MTAKAVLSLSKSSDMQFIPYISRFIARISPFVAVDDDLTVVPTNDTEREESSLESVVERKEAELPKYSKAFLNAVNYVLEHEAGYVDHPKDPGGATNMGITQETLARWRGYSEAEDIPKSEVKNLSREEAIDIYDAAYWDACRCDNLPPALDYAVFDFAVNSGPARAVKKLQSVLGVDADGVIGGITLRAIERKSNNYPALVNAYMDARLRYMKVIRHRKTRERLWDTFGRGWQKRVDDVREKSLHFAGGGRGGGGGGGW